MGEGTQSWVRDGTPKGIKKGTYLTEVLNEVYCVVPCIGESWESPGSLKGEKKRETGKKKKKSTPLIEGTSWP